MKNLATLSLLVLCSMSCSAQWGNKVKGNGERTTIERSVGDYDRIGVSGFFDVDLISGREGEITLSGESNLLKHIITEVKNGQLNIKTEKGYNLSPSSWKDGIHITVPVESIDAVALSGSGDIVGKTKIKSSDFKTSMSGSGDITLDIDADNISTAMSGSGDINLSGRAINFDATISGSGDIAAYDLEADNVEATVSGSANIEVTANKKIKARVSGSGDIDYKGNPEKVDTKTSGSGDITKK
ncbi:head GIN domain-containing protein [Aurantibacter sp.]|uniref:head GIN domain-containing protein n=1 Tax=Aurantibacter sp. TaxID=2807103 RepID=UPI0032668446